ncbi:MAG: hypothetical protein AAF378_16725 [Cyanobacteria bacterium P01_A01_bin.84]
MSISKKVLLPTLAIGSVVFATCSLILFTQGNKTLQVRLDKQDILNSRIKDTVSPFVGVIFSLGVGLGSAAVVGWGQSLRKTSELHKSILNLQDLISEKESQIQEMKMSPSQINRSQLNWFLEEEENKIYTSQNSSSESTYPLEDALDSVKLKEAGTKKDRNFIVLDSTSAFPSAQSAIGLTKEGSSRTTSSSTKVSK